MKNAVRRLEALTLVELLVVIVVLYILAALILPVPSPRSRPARIPQARLEMASIVSAVRDFQADNGVYPVSEAVRQAAASVAAGQGGPEDCTFGSQVFSSNSVPVPLSTPNLTNNAEVIAILMDLEKYGNGMPTINAGHAYNPKRTVYLYAKPSGDTHSPGLGLDRVYRDPWGTPYLISLDLNGDHKTRDAFYRRQTVSQQSGTNGFHGLVNTSEPAGNSDGFEANVPIMVWSAGPDKKFDPSQPANVGVNKDNVLSWQ